MRKKQSFGLEAGIKYFLIGTFSSAVMLFGMALLYSTSGTIYLADMAQVLPGIINQPGVIIGLLFTLGGFFFKLAVFPFHFWAPDTYQGAANQVAAYIATASKVAAIAVILRVVAFAGHGSAYLVHVPGDPLGCFDDPGKPCGHRAKRPQKAARVFDDSAFRLCAASGYWF